MEVSKSAWKLSRTRIGEWQETYMERLVKEYMDLLDKIASIDKHIINALKEKLDGEISTVANFVRVQMGGKSCYIRW